MRLLLTLIVLTTFSFTTTAIMQATCGDTQAGPTETSSGSACADPVPETAGSFTKTVTWAHIYWLDGYDRTGVAVSDEGKVVTQACLATALNAGPGSIHHFSKSPATRPTGFKRLILEELF